MDPYLGEIRNFAFNFAPIGWLQCQGQTLNINQYAALFSIIGTYYGGNGTTNFQLPNLQGIVPIGTGQGPGLSPFVQGQAGGETQHTLVTNEMPLHTHVLTARAGNALVATPVANSMLAQGHEGGRGAAFDIFLYTTHAPGTTLAPAAVGPAGNSQACLLYTSRCV